MRDTLSAKIQEKIIADLERRTKPGALSCAGQTVTSQGLSAPPTTRFNIDCECVFGDLASNVADLLVGVMAT